MGGQSSYSVGRLGYLLNTVCKIPVCLLWSEKATRQHAPDRRLEFIEMDQITELKMAIDSTFSSILNQIQSSNLNFSMQMTPYAAYITLKKSVVKDQNVPSPPILMLLQRAHQNIADLRYENEHLKVKYEALEESKEYLMNENVKLVEALDASNHSLAASNASNDMFHRKLELAEENNESISASKKTCETDLKDIKKSHCSEIANAKSVINAHEKDKKSLEKEIYNLKKNLDSSRDKLKHLKTEHSSLKMCKTKLDTESNKLKKVINQKDSIIAKLRKNKELELNENHENCNSPDTLSSTNFQGNSSSGCHCISSTESGPIFTSMVSHWNSLPTRTSSSNSITSMITHCVKSASTASSLCTAQEFQEMLDRLVERAFANLRWNTIKQLAQDSNRD